MIQTIIINLVPFNDGEFNLITIFYILILIYFIAILYFTYFIYNLLTKKNKNKFFYWLNEYNK